MKYITSTVQKFFPTLPKKSTWEQAFDVLNQTLNITLGLYDRVLENKTKALYIEVFKGDDSVVKEEYVREYRMRYIPKPGEFDWEAIYQTAIELCIKNKVIKKPRNAASKIKEHDDEKKELIKQRDRLTMKIWAWKKQNKDISDLLIEKESLAKKIKSL